MFKWLLIALAVLGGGLYLLIANLGGIVKTGVETVGPMVLKTDVALADAEIGPFSGTRLEGLVVSNPEGYKTESAFSLDEVFVDLDITSLMGDTIKVKEIMIDGPHITYEGTLTKSNLKTLVDQMGGDETSSEEPSSEAPSTEEPIGEEKETNIEIDLLTIKNITLWVSTPLTGNQPIKLKLPDIVKKDIGKGEPVDIPTLVRDLNKELYGQVLPAVQKQMKNLGKNLDQLGKNILKGGGNSKESLKETAGKIKNNLRGLFGK